MFISDILVEDSPLTINEAKRETVTIFPGRFQPPHIGHMKSWQWLNSKYGKAYIATSDKVAPPKSPFNFAEKKQLFMHAGVPSDAIVQVKNPYQALEIVNQFDVDNITLLFAISEKDMDEDPRFSFRPKKDGSPGYLQPLKDNIADPKSAREHAYVVTVPTFDFKVLGKPMRSATEFRAQFAQADDSTQAKMITGLYGSYNEEVHRLMQERIT